MLSCVGITAQRVSYHQQVNLTKITKNKSDPANTRRSTNLGTMLYQRRRQCLNIETLLGRCLVFTGDRPNVPDMS